MENVVYDHGPFVVYQLDGSYYVQYEYGHSNLRRTKITEDEFQTVKKGTEYAKKVILEAQRRENLSGDVWIL